MIKRVLFGSLIALLLLALTGNVPAAPKPAAPPEKPQKAVLDACIGEAQAFATQVIEMRKLGLSLHEISWIIRAAASISPDIGPYELAVLRLQNAYLAALRLYDATSKRDPESPEAAANLLISRRILSTIVDLCVSYNTDEQAAPAPSKAAQF